MVKQQILAWGPIDDDIAKLFLTIDRRHFMTKPFQDVAYADLNVPMRHGEVMLSPSIQAKMMQALQLQDHETVLEIGTGNGFLTALLASRAKHVISVDFHRDLSTQAVLNLEEQGIHNVECQVGNAALGWKVDALVDVLVITGGLHFLPEGLRACVKENGRILAMLGQGPLFDVLLMTTSLGGSRTEQIFETEVPVLRRAPLLDDFEF